MLIPRLIWLSISYTRTWKRSISKRKSWKLSEAEKSIITYEKLLSRTVEARRQWHNSFKVLNKNYFQSINLHLSQLLIKCESRIEAFSDIDLRHYSLINTSQQVIWSHFLPLWGRNQEKGKKSLGILIKRSLKMIVALKSRNENHRL